MLWEHSRQMKVAKAKTFPVPQRQLEILERNITSKYWQIRESVFALQPVVGWEGKTQVPRLW